MAKTSTRRVTIYINGKEVEASVKQIRSEMNKLVNVNNHVKVYHFEPFVTRSPKSTVERTRSPK